jgi:hypothetical protein
MADTYRFRWKGCELQNIIQHVPPGTTVAIANAMAKAWVDVTLDPGAPGSPAQADLDGVMLDMGWVPFSVNPTTPLRAVTTKQSLEAVLVVDAAIAAPVAFATLLSQAITTDAGSISVDARVSGEASVAVYFQIVLDGVPMSGGGATMGGTGAVAIKRTAPIAAGAHVVEVQWRLASAGVASVRPVSAPDGESATLGVSEFVT